MAKRSNLLVARAGELAPGRSKKFFLEVDGREVECFLVNWRGAHYAYVNRCRHVGMSLDWVENRFFDETGCWILCPTHGACYEPDSGACVEGPPIGKRLVRVPLKISGDGIYAGIPDDLEDVVECAGT